MYMSINMTINLCIKNMYLLFNSEITAKYKKSFGFSHRCALSFVCRVGLGFDYRDLHLSLYLYGVKFGLLIY